MHKSYKNDKSAHHDMTLLVYVLQIMLLPV